MDLSSCDKRMWKVYSVIRYCVLIFWGCALITCMYGSNVSRSQNLLDSVSNVYSDKKADSIGHFPNSLIHCTTYTARRVPRAQEIRWILAYVAGVLKVQGQL